MLTELREELILNYLKQHQFAKLLELSKITGCSESTIRRDLDRLEIRGNLVKIRGGAKIAKSLRDEPDIETKNKVNTDAKAKIGEYAASLVENGDVIFIDAGSTTANMVSNLADKKDILVVTNGIEVASLLSNFKVSTYLLGGMIKSSTKAITGFESIDRIRDFQFNKSFLGINGIDTEKGFTTPDIQEADIKKQVILQSKETFVLADQSKFDEVSFVKVADAKSLKIITNQTASEYKDMKIMEV